MSPHQATRRFSIAIVSFSFLVFLLCPATGMTQTETVLYNFSLNGPAGIQPQYPVVVDQEGNIYGTTQSGGANRAGTVFELTASGSFSVLYSFSGLGADEWPDSQLTMDANGNLYGMTQPGTGEIFMISPTGTETVFDNSGDAPGYSPQGGLVWDKMGNLYGATCDGGANFYGTVFKLTPSTGSLSTFYSFKGGVNGYCPKDVVLDKKGNLYGVTRFGGPSGWGVVFKVTRFGKETVLHNFAPNGTDGLYPNSLTINSKGVLFGTTTMGGAYGAGTVFEMTTTGTETILHNFSGAPDGFFPYAGVVLDQKGNLYGTTEYGGAFGLGTVFELTPSGTETILHSFADDGIDGFYPLAGLALDQSGDLYGTTIWGGDDPTCGLGCGTIFKIAPAKRKAAGS